MPEIINWPELDSARPRSDRDLLCWFIIETMTRRANQVDGHGDITKSFPDMDATKLEVKMTINGVEVPVMDTFRQVEEQFDRIVAKAASDMLKEKLNDGVDKFNQIVDNALHDFHEKLGVELDRY